MVHWLKFIKIACDRRIACSLLDMKGNQVVCTCTLNIRHSFFPKIYMLLLCSKLARNGGTVSFNIIFQNNNFQKGYFFYFFFQKLVYVIFDIRKYVAGCPANMSILSLCILGVDSSQHRS